jgi:poly(A) polymerase
VLDAPLADELTSRGGLMLAALLHDMAKPATRAVTAEGRVTFIGHDRLGAEMAETLMRRLRTSARLRDFVVRGVRWHLPLGFMVHRTPLSLRQIDRYLRLTAPSEAEIIVLSVADRLATRGPRTSRSAIERHLVLAREVMDAHFSLVDRPPPRPLLAGDEVAAALGRPPGPWLAPLLDALREGQTVGVLRTRDQALRFARGWREN